MCGAIIPGDAKVCPECGAVFEDDEDDTTAVALGEEEEEPVEEEDEEYEDEEVEPAKANRMLFWIGLVALIIGSQAVALGSFVHNKLGWFVTVTRAPYPNANGTYVVWGDSSKVYGFLDQTVGVIGIVITLIAFILIFIYMKQQSDEEKYRRSVEERKEAMEDEEKDEEDEEEEEEEFEPLLVQNKLFFWVGIGLLLFTGPLGVIFGFTGADPSAAAGTAGMASGSTLTIIGFILLFLAIRDALFRTKEEPEEEDNEEDEEDYEDEEESEDEEDFDSEDEDEEELGDDLEHADNVEEEEELNEVRRI